MKTIVVVVPGSGTKHEVTIKEGSTPRDVLDYLKLDDYQLRRPDSDDVNDTFGMDEDIYPEVKDGQSIQASTGGPVGD